MNGEMALKENFSFKVIRKADRVQKAPLLWRIKNNIRSFLAGEFLVPVAAFLARLVPGLTVMTSKTYVKVIKADGTVVDYGMVGCHTVTTVGKGFIVDAWQNSVELENMKYHGIGTGTTGAAAGDTALETESTTAYNPDNTRATGSTTEASATVFRTVGTNTVDASVAVTEWGLLSQAATGGGVLFDRQTFAAVNLVSGDSLQTTYDLTVS